MLSTRASSLKPSPTLAIAAKAKQLQAEGHKVISLSVGEPDWDTFPDVKRVGIQAIEAGQTKYAPANGLLPLRQAIAKQTAEQIGITYSAQAVTVSAGAKFILFAALQCLVDPDDEVVVVAPYWVSYPTMVELADGRPVIATSLNDIATKVTAKTKVLLFNSPSNPTGEVYSRADLQKVVDIMKKYPRLVVISDDIYNQLVFTGEVIAPHVLQIAPDLRDRVLVVNGASKSYSMTGWRVGWALGPEPLILAMTNYQSQSVSCASPFSQLATLQAIQSGSAQVAAAVGELKGRRDQFVQALQAIPGWKVASPQGAFYVWADIRQLLGSVSDSEFAEKLLTDEKVAVVPGSESGAPGFVRLSFALSAADLKEASVRLSRFSARFKT